MGNDSEGIVGRPGLAGALLWLNALVFAGFGIACVIAPAAVAQWSTGAVPGSPSALIDMRAVYGGMMIGFGLWLGLCATRPSVWRLGMQAALLVVLGMALGRLLGMFWDGQPNALMWIYLFAELAMSVLLIWALRPQAGMTA